VNLIYVVLLIAFGGLVLFTLTDFYIRRASLAQDLDELQERLAQQEERLTSTRQELDDLTIECELMEQEKLSLKARETCMRGLDRFDAVGAETDGRQARHG
jgi:cell division protein FtsB